MGPRSEEAWRVRHWFGMFGVLSNPPLSSLLPLGPSTTTSQLISDTRIINKTFAHKGDWDSSLPALPLSYKSIKYNFKIKYKEQKGPDLGATCSPQENESTHSSRTCLGDRGAPSQPHRAWRCRGEEKGRGPAPGPGGYEWVARPPRTKGYREGTGICRQLPGPPVPRARTDGGAEAATPE